MKTNEENERMPIRIVDAKGMKAITDEAKKQGLEVLTTGGEEPAIAFILPATEKPTSQ